MVSLVSDNPFPIPVISTTTEYSVQTKPAVSGTLIENKTSITYSYEKGNSVTEVSVYKTMIYDSTARMYHHNSPYGALDKLI